MFLDILIGKQAFSQVPECKPSFCVRRVGYNDIVRYYRKCVALRLQYVLTCNMTSL